jgi:hypothetical protein
MDIGTMTAAYTALKHAQEVLATILKRKIETEVQARVAEVLEKLGQAQDTLFSMREDLFQSGAYMLPLFSLHDFPYLALSSATFRASCRPDSRNATAALRSSTASRSFSVHAILARARCQAA